MRTALGPRAAIGRPSGTRTVRCRERAETEWRPGGIVDVEIEPAHDPLVPPTSHRNADALIRRLNHRFGEFKTGLRPDFERDAAVFERAVVRDLGCRRYRPIPWRVTPDEELRAIAVD